MKVTWKVYVPNGGMEYKAEGELQWAGLPTPCGAWVETEFHPKLWRIVTEDNTPYVEVKCAYRYYLYKSRPVGDVGFFGTTTENHTFVDLADDLAYEWVREDNIKVTIEYDEQGRQ